MDGIDQFDDQVDALAQSLGGAVALTAAFDGELKRMQATVADTGREVGVLSRGILRGLRSAFDGLVFDGLKLGDALKEVAESMSRAAYSAAINPVTNHFGGLLAQSVEGVVNGLLPFGDGAGFAQGRVMPFARGGIVSQAAGGSGGRGARGERDAECPDAGRRGVPQIRSADRRDDGPGAGAWRAQSLRRISMTFHDVRFPASLSFGSVGGPERRTEIVTLQNGFEERNTPWAQSRRRYDAGVSLRSLDDVEQLLAFFEARQGQLHGFRWKDWADYKSCLPSEVPGAEDQVIGLGDGVRTEFQLVKSYASGAQTYVRPIEKAVFNSVLIGLAGDPMVLGVDYDLDLDTGLVTIGTAPAEAAAVTAGFEFDVPVRFDTDRIQVSVASFRAGDVPSVPVVEIRL